MSRKKRTIKLEGPYVVCRVYVDHRDDDYFVFPTDDEEKAQSLAREALRVRARDEDRPPALQVVQEPHHSTVGHRFRGMEGIYRCTSYDSSQGFWMENEADPKDRRNVSERAPGRTFHRILPEAL